MRRTLAVAAIAAGLATTSIPSASAAPACDVAQNCVCSIVNVVLDKVGEELGCA